jgi:hypothetical protein
VPDVLISCMALRQVPDWLPWAGEAPKLLEFPGVPTESGHPSWQRAARTLRGSDGAILPALFARYHRYLGFGLAETQRIAAVGFSAGSNSGIRTLLESPLDRARLDFAAAVDGMHPTLQAEQRGIHRPLSDDPRSDFVAWQQQMGGFEAYALDAAQGACGFVATASAVAPTQATVSTTAQALSALYAVVAQATGPSSPNLPASYPPRTSSPSLRDGEEYPIPYAIEGVGNFVALWYAGDQKRDHVLQAAVVVPDVLRAFLVPRWGGPSPGLVSAGPDEPPDAADAASTQAKVSGLPDFTGAALAVPAAAAAALVRS